MLEIVPLTIESARAVSPDVADIIAARGPGGPAWAALVDGSPIAIGGFSIIHEGCAEAWVAVAPGLSNTDRLALALAVKRRFARESAAWKRVQASTVVGNTSAARLTRWLGFTPEGLMRAWGRDGSDHIRYARIRE